MDKYEDLGIYRCALMLDHQIKKNSFSCILNRMQKILTYQKSNSFSFPLRVTMAQYSLAIIPIYINYLNL